MIEVRIFLEIVELLNILTQDEIAMWSNDYPEPSEQSEKDAKERPMWQGSDNAFKGKVSPSQVYICMCVFRMLYTVFWSYSPLPQLLSYLSPLLTYQTLCPPPPSYFTPTKPSLCCPNIPGCAIFYGSMASLSGTALLEKTVSPTQSS